MSKKFKLKFVGHEPVRLPFISDGDIKKGDVVEFDETSYQCLLTHDDWKEETTAKAEKEAK